MCCRNEVVSCGSGSKLSCVVSVSCNIFSLIFHFTRHTFRFRLLPGHTPAARLLLSAALIILKVSRPCNDTEHFTNLFLHGTDYFFDSPYIIDLYYHSSFFISSLLLPSQDTKMSKRLTGLPMSVLSFYSSSSPFNSYILFVIKYYDLEVVVDFFFSVFRLSFLNKRSNHFSVFLWSLEQQGDIRGSFVNFSFMVAPPWPTPRMITSCNQTRRCSDVTGHVMSCQCSATNHFRPPLRQTTSVSCINFESISGRRPQFRHRSAYPSDRCVSTNFSFIVQALH